jgi:hypothetical protein
MVTSCHELLGFFRTAFDGKLHWDTRWLYLGWRSSLGLKLMSYRNVYSESNHRNVYATQAYLNTCMKSVLAFLTIYHSSTSVGKNGKR